MKKTEGKDYNFQNIIEEIGNKSPLQKKKLSKYLTTRDYEFYSEANKFVAEYSGYLSSQNIPMEYAVDSYIKMCNDMVKSQIFFLKTGKYPMEDADLVYETVYSNENEMKPLMIALALSQFLWSTHYDMYSSFSRCIKENKSAISSYLEVGPGHGLFLKNAIEILNSKVKFTVIDISDIAMNITKSIIKYFFYGLKTNIKYLVKDMLKLDTNQKYDFINMGEVLEHVNNPKSLVDKFQSLLSYNGKGFLSTCVNCPTTDHVYHFHSINEIREMINSSNLRICKELVLPTENIPMNEIIKNKITINYCAIVEVNKNE